MPKDTITLLGGSGFVGRALCERLVRAGYALRILTRARLAARDLWLLPDTTVIAGDVYDADFLRSAVAGANAVINLVGILNERGDDGRGFERAHVDLTRLVLAACAASGVTRYLHMSALNAAADAPSYYLRSKAAAETLVASSGLNTTIFRPSVIFGPGDGLFVRFDQLTALAPVLPLACAAARFQPVYVGDVADAFVHALGDKATVGKRYDLGGPSVMSLQEVVAYTLRQRGRCRLVLPLGSGLSRVMAEIMEHLPGKPFSRDNLRSASLNSVLAAGHDGLAELHIPKTSVAAIVPAYLGQRGVLARYDRLREHAGR